MKPERESDPTGNTPMPGEEILFSDYGMRVIMILWAYRQRPMSWDEEVDLVRSLGRGGHITNRQIFAELIVRGYIAPSTSVQNGGEEFGLV